MQCPMAMATILQVLPVAQACKQASGDLHARATKGRCYRTTVSKQNVLIIRLKKTHQETD